MPLPSVDWTLAKALIEKLPLHLHTTQLTQWDSSVALSNEEKQRTQERDMFPVLYSRHRIYWSAKILIIVIIHYRTQNRKSQTRGHLQAKKGGTA